MFLQFSPVRAEKKPKPVKKVDESEKLEVLSLAPFTPNPKLFFEDVKVGVTVSRKLLINNATNQDVNLFVSSHIPEDLNVTLNWVETIIEKNANSILELTWCPLKVEASRHVITIEDGKKIRRDVPIAFKSVSPKKLKAGTKVKAKPQTNSQRHTSPLKRKSPIKKPSSTKKYYSNRPSKVSPKKFSSPKHYSPTLHKYSPSPKKCSPSAKCLLQRSSPSPKLQRERLNYYTESLKTNKGNLEPKCGKYMITDKENFPLSLLNSSVDSNIFVSPRSATFQMDYMQPSEQRRETYVVNGMKDKSPADTKFSDSLEASSPEVSPHITRVNFSPSQRKPLDILRKKLPLGISNCDNVSPSVHEFMQKKLSELPTNRTFEYKLLQLDSFCFTPVSTPVKRPGNFNTPAPATKQIVSAKNSPQTSASVKLPAEIDQTYEIQNSPNISTETYVKSNLSGETYVKGNASFETYVKGNLSGGTYAKDSSIGDVANLSLSPISHQYSPGVAKGTNVNQPCITRTHSLVGNNVRNVIEANLWPGVRTQPLCSIQEESYIQKSMSENNDENLHRSFLKRKSYFNISCTPSKRPNVSGTSNKEWSKTGGAAVRIAKKSSGLNLKQFFKDKSFAEGNKETTAVLTKKDTNMIIIQNPFLLAATNLVDPFMTSNLYINEEWLDQQQIDFKKWLNALLTPPEELSANEQVVDVAKVWKECKKKDVDAAPTKEEVSSKYHTNNKLNSLRKSAQNLFRSNEMSAVLSKVVLAVETGRLAIRKDKDVHLNLALKSEAMSMLLSYNPLWLRIGLETIYNEIIPLKSNSDVMGLSTFIANRVLKDPYLIKKHKVLHAPKYIADFKKFFLKKFFVLVYFLDQAKAKKLIPHDPCLFCKTAPVKESREMLIRLGREMLAAVGDITKYLKHIGYVVTHVQMYIHEFDYAVNSLGVDLRDGVRLTRLMEIILMQDNLTSNLRVPAISRLQKIHNMKIVFDSLGKAGYKILYDISPRDIVDSHKEKTLSFLWQIIYKFEAPLMVKSATTVQVWFRSLPVVLKRRKLERIRLERESAATKIQLWYRRLKLAQKLIAFTLILKEHLMFISLTRAAIRIQSYYRMYRCRSTYTIQYKTLLNIQRLARGWVVRNVHRERIKKSIILQRNIRMYLARKRYLKIKNATNTIQARYRSKKLTERCRTEYNRLKTSVTFIQRQFRANRLSARDKSSYQELRLATICIQQRYRAIRLCRTERQRYLKVRWAATRIQIWYKSLKSMSMCRDQFVTLKKTVIVMEQRYVALRAMKVERRNYQTLRKACITVQQRYRALTQMKIERRVYLDLKAAIVTLQQRYCAKKMMERQRQHFESLKSHTVFIQRKFRAIRAMKISQSDYTRVRVAAIKIQLWYKSTREMRRCRTQYVSLKYAVQIFEDRYQAKRQMQIQRSNYQRLKFATVVLQRRYRALVEMRQEKTDYYRLKYTVVFIQRKFRANKMAKVQRCQYLKLKQTSIVIQNRYRAQKSMQNCRREFVNLKVVVVAVQRRFRANILMKEAREYYLSLLKYTIIAQRRFRANQAMVVERDSYKKLKTVTVCIQRRWRAKKLGESQNQTYRKLRKAAMIIQQMWRAKKLTQQQRTEYIVLKKVVTVVQSKWRANKLGYEVRSNYMQLKNAVAFIQTRWRAKKLGQEHSNRYNKIKSATVFVQRKWRANKLARLERAKYVTMKKTVEFMQVKWRANKLATKVRDNYLQMKKATVVLQQRWKAKKLSEIHKKEYNKLKNAVVFVQRKWRANKLAKQERIKYEAFKKATRFVQAKWRANKLANKERHKYLRLKNAVVTVQQKWRANKLTKQHRKEYNKLKNAVVFVQRKWRANTLARYERVKYEALKKSTGFVQAKWRANKLANKEKHKYLQLKNAVVTVQQRWIANKLAEQYRNEYNKLKNTVVFVQRKWRANKLAKQERVKYDILKKSTRFVQAKWMANKLATKERHNYLRLKNAVLTLQHKWRANKLAEQCRKRYNMLKNASVFIQTSWRANKLSKLERTKYKALREATVCIQNRWRAKKVGNEERCNYLQLKKAAHILQLRWRAKALGKQEKVAYDSLRKSTIFIQRKWRANKLAKEESARYRALKKVVVFTQSKWRGKKERLRYLLLLNATITLQQRWRARKLCREQKDRYELLRKTTIFIQRKWRAKIAAKWEKRKYEQIRKSVVTIQRQWRAEKVRKDFIQFKNATIVIQQRWRAKIACKQQTQSYEKLRQITIFIQIKWRLKQLARQDRSNYETLRTAALNIQRRWRAQKLMVTTVHQYTVLKSSTIFIQRRFRAQMLMKREKDQYTKIHASVIVIQRFFRAYLKMKQEQKDFAMKRKAVLLLQKYIRGFLVRRKFVDYFSPEAREQRRIEMMEKQAAIRIQAIWRGYRSRSIEKPELVKIRQRARKANVKAEPHNTLGSRCKVALQTLVNDKSTLFVINKSLEDLDFITRHSRNMCVQVAQFLPEQIYLMIKHTNRSLPEMNACIFSTHILINCYKYRPTRNHSFIPEYLDNIITIMLHWCDKEAQVFPSICTLLWLFAHNPNWRDIIKSVPNVGQRLSKIESQILRKESMVKRTGVKGQSLFVTYKNLPIPSLEPDWGLEYKHKPNIFTNSVHAIHSLLRILDL